MIERTFTYKVPDTWRSDQFTQGKTATFTYKGPRYLTFEIDIDTGKESGWCLWEPMDLERPVALNEVRITIDADESDEMALLAEIANDHGDPDQVKFRTERNWSIMYDAPEGYEKIWMPDEVEPRDIYDEFNITYDFEIGEFNIPVKTWETDGWNMNITWDEIKDARDRMLEQSDGKISPDMPASITSQWTDYRQLLRDMPSKLADTPAWQAAHMFPATPGLVPTNHDPEAGPSL